MHIAVKVLFCVFATLAIVGRATGELILWQLGYPAPAVCCAILVLCCWASPGISCPSYASGVLLGLVLMALSDVLIVENAQLQLFYLSYLLNMAGAFCFSFAFWAPSVKVSRLGDANVDTSRSAPAASSAGVPLHLLRLFPALALIGAVVGVWGSGGFKVSPIVPMGVYLGSLLVMLWRGFARIGYRVPVPTAEIKKMLKRSMTKPMQEWEHVELQWAGAFGAFFVALSQGLIGYNRLWQSDGIVPIQYGAAVVHWLGIALVTASVPTVDPPLPNLRDTSLVPEPYDGGTPMRVLVILPDRDFDVTEVAVPWFMLRRRGHDVVFATEHGTVASADPLLLTGVLCGQLGADMLPKQMYFDMENDPAFLKPITWSSIVPEAFDGLILPGGHAPGMRQYLGSSLVQEKIAEFWALDRPVGAICHGVLVLARSKNPDTGRSILRGATATCLPGYMEQSAYALTCCCRGRYYRTYPRTVQSEVTQALGRRGRFMRGPVTFTRGTPWDNTHAYVVEHGQLITCRWPGDAFLFARRFITMLEEVPRLY